MTRIMLLCLGLVVYGYAAIAAAPPQLFGKSVVVSRTEDRMQRHSEDSPFHRVIMQVRESIYISGAGRFFAQTTFPGATRANGWCFASRTGNHQL
jgi:hypothetical protein